MLKILVLLLTLSFLGEPEQDYGRYFCEAGSLEEAEAIAVDMDAELLTYVDGIATYHLNRPLKDILARFSINAYAPEEVGVVTLKQDGVCYPEGKNSKTPAINALYDPMPFKEMEWTNTYMNGITGSGAVVAVIDTGCNIYHEDLKENIIGGYNATDGSMVVTDTDGHGTHVCGIVAARDNDVGNIGVAPDAKLYPIKASSTNSAGRSVFYHSDLIRALNKCVSLGNIDVVNMSLGGGSYDEDFKSAIENCMNHGILCVIAAGNEGTDDPCYPAAYGIGLRVAATYDDILTYYSNYGQNCNIAAQGHKITSTYFDGYKSLNGTSMASPEVAGIAALVYSKYDIPRSRTGSETVKNIILDAKSDKVYTNKDHSVKGGANVQNIFHATVVRSPEKPSITVEEESGTKQKLITLQGSHDIYYTLDGSTPSIYTSKLYNEPIRLDTAGTYTLKTYAMNKRASSKIVTQEVTVFKDVISEKQLEKVELSCEDVRPGGSATVSTGTKIPNNRFKWKSKKPEKLSVDSKGVVTASSSAKRGDKVKIVAKIGSHKYKVKVKIGG